MQGQSCGDGQKKEALRSKGFLRGATLTLMWQEKCSVRREADCPRRQPLRQRV